MMISLELSKKMRKKMTGKLFFNLHEKSNSKKHDFIPSRTRKNNTERGVVQRPSEKKKQG